MNLSLYVWVKRNRPDLLATLVPTRASFFRDTSFEEYDRTTAAVIRQVGPTVRASLLRSHHKITRTRLLKAMNQQKLLNSRRRPIQSLAAISELIETDRQHFERLFQSMRESLKSDRNLSRMSLILKSAHLHAYYMSSEDYRTRLREAILEARIVAGRSQLPVSTAMP